MAQPAAVPSSSLLNKSSHGPPSLHLAGQNASEDTALQSDGPSALPAVSSATPLGVDALPMGELLTADTGLIEAVLRTGDALVPLQSSISRHSKSAGLGISSRTAWSELSSGFARRPDSDSEG